MAKFAPDTTTAVGPIRKTLSLSHRCVADINIKADFKDRCGYAHMYEVLRTNAATTLYLGVTVGVMPMRWRSLVLFDTDQPC